jgi:hypothetical protein
MKQVNTPQLHKYIATNEHISNQHGGALDEQLHTIIGELIKSSHLFSLCLRVYR